MPLSLVLAGCGKMGSALLEGWLDRGIERDAVRVVEPDGKTAAAVRDRHGVSVVGAAVDLPAGLRPDVVVLAVKPQTMDEALPGVRRFADEGALFLSIAAGKTIAYFQSRLGAGARIVRSMPNTPAAVRRGITVAVANAAAGAEGERLAHGLLEAVGEVAWVDDESLLDAVTALSGGGPAYVFLLVEALAQAGAAAGLPTALAARLARATVAGAGELLHRSAEAPEVLRRNVTSPGGTTQAALQVLMGEGGWQPLIDRAVAAAAARSRELAG